MSKIGTRKERKRVREALKFLGRDFDGPQYYLVLFPVEDDDDHLIVREILENLLVDEVTPETLLLEQEAQELENKVRDEIDRRKVYNLAHKLILADKSPETFIRQCEVMGFKCSDQAQKDPRLEMIEALCFVRNSRPAIEDTVEDLDSIGYLQ